MKITAKFAGKCEKCGGGISVGQTIEWEKGKGSRHIACPAKSTTAPPPAPRTRTPRAQKAPAKQPEGTSYISRRSQDRHDNYVAGDVLHCTRVPGGGGDDGRYWTVVTVLPKHKDDDTDEWHCAAYVRPATDAECAPLVERRRAVEGRAAALKELQSLAGDGWRATWKAASKPAGREFTIHPGAHGSGRVVGVLSPDEGAVAVWCSGHYDDYIQTLAVTRDPRAVEIARSLLAEAR